MYEEDPGPLDSDDPALAKGLEKYFEIIHRDNYKYTIHKEYNFPLKNRQVTYEDIDEQQVFWEMPRESCVTFTRLEMNQF